MSTEWHDIRDGDPPEWTKVLVTRNGKTEIAEVAFDLYFEIGGSQMHDVTHWAPLPDPAVKTHSAMQEHIRRTL